MYPSRFRYEAPRSLDEAIGLLHEGGDEAKVLAGGQSLVPLMKLRFASPELIVDINNVPRPRLPPRRPGRHAARSARCAGTPTWSARACSRRTQPTMAAAAPLIADPIVRNRGTLVGSLCHADPQGDWASVVTALGGSVVAQGPARPAHHPDRRLRHRAVPERPGLRRDRRRGRHPGGEGHPLRRLPQAGAAGRRLRDRRGRGGAGDLAAATVTRAGHRPDRGRRVHHRGHRGGRRRWPASR